MSLYVLCVPSCPFPPVFRVSTCHPPTHSPFSTGTTGTTGTAFRINSLGCPSLSQLAEFTGTKCERQVIDFQRKRQFVCTAVVQMMPVCKPDQWPKHEAERHAGSHQGSEFSPSVHGRAGPLARVKGGRPRITLVYSQRVGN